MSDFVLDCSVTMGWCFEDATDPLADRALSALGGGASAVVPPLWRYQVANLLAMAERRDRIGAAAAERFLDLLGRLPIEDTAAPDARDVLLVARTHGLSAYDAAYLDLANRLGLPLATRDAALAEAARASGTKLAKFAHDP